MHRLNKRTLQTWLDLEMLKSYKNEKKKKEKQSMLQQLIM